MKYYETLVFNTCGENTNLAGARVGKFRGYYGIQYNHSGPLSYSRDGSTPQIVEGSYAFFTYPGPYFNYGAPQGMMRHHCYICFSGSLVRRFIAGGMLDLQRRSPLIEVVNSEKFYASMHQLITLIQRAGGTSNPRSAWLLEDILLQLNEQPGSRSKINVFCEQQLHQLREKIVQNPLNNWDFEQEASQMSISYPHFRRLFRDVVGSAPRQFLIEARLDYATKLLENDVLPISEVAHRSGFEDEFYFSRLFKKHRLISPSAIRGSKHHNN